MNSITDYRLISLSYIIVAYLMIACEQALVSYLGKRSEPRENARAKGLGKESLQRSFINFHFHPGNPGTPQGVKMVTANVPQIRKVTTACQVSLDSRGRVELFIYKSLSQQHQGNVFNHWYVFFFTGTSNFNVSARIRTHYFDSRFVYFWKVVHTAA